jgi:hypothetical protein
MPGVLDHPLLSDLSGMEYVKVELDRTAFVNVRGSILEGKRDCYIHQNFPDEYSHLCGHTPSIAIATYHPQDEDIGISLCQPPRLIAHLQ